MGPKEGPWDISWRAGNMFLNRLCIDEDAAFETQGIYFIESFHNSEPMDNDMVHEPVHKRKRKPEGRAKRNLCKIVSFDNQLICVIAFYQLSFSFKDVFDDKVINHIFHSHRQTEIEQRDLELHFVYAGKFCEDFHFNYDDWYWHKWIPDNLGSLLINGMERYKMESVKMTIINVQKRNLITYEEMKAYYSGHLRLKNSFNNELESLYENLRLGEAPVGKANTYFLPKLTEKEEELVKRKSFQYFRTFYHSLDSDIIEYKMKLSKSVSKFAFCDCLSRTLILYSKYN